MYRRYQPLLQRWSRRTLRDADDAAEVSQLVWVELARRIHEFDYNPQGSFRGWLRRLHRSRSLDFLKGRKRYAERLERFALQPDSDDPHGSLGSATWNDANRSQRLDKQSRLVDLQARVQSRVSPQTWQVFWSVVVENRTVSDVAAEHSMRYASAFAAVARVTKMLQREAQR
jgi:RNA polymerase sigma factor (sigma-70 family)